jgi:hypothetical protein
MQAVLFHLLNPDRLKRPQPHVQRYFCRFDFALPQAL